MSTSLRVSIIDLNVSLSTRITHELKALKLVATQKDDGFQTYLSKFQYLVAQAQAGDTPAV